MGHEDKIIKIPFDELDPQGKEFLKHSEKGICQRCGLLTDLLYCVNLDCMPDETEGPLIKVQSQGDI